MRISILSSGRFHVCDLARELDRLGHQVTLHSLVPPWRLASFGLARRSQRWLGMPLVPIVIAGRLLPGSSMVQRVQIEALDRVSARAMRPCDVFIGMSGMSRIAAGAARKRWGAKVFIERGSRHILSQRAILDARPDRKGMSTIPDWAVDRELADYAVADAVVVPARHVVDSFVEQGFASDRLFRNPYGVDLEAFPWSTGPGADARPTVISVGTWCFRKGSDLLARAMKALPGTRLLHVGSVGDLGRPGEEWFEHHGPVEQSELPTFYARAHVAVQASREEGLALVQPQALASGLPLVCSDRAGGGDLAELVKVTDAIRVVPTGRVEDLAQALALALDASRTRKVREDLREERGQLGWSRYAERYDRFLRG